MARGTDNQGDTSVGEESLFTKSESAEPSSEGGASPAIDPQHELLKIAPAALLTALEAIPSPTFVLRAPTTVLLANRRGQSLLEADRERVLSAFLEKDPAHGAIRLPVDSAPDHQLVVLRDLEGDATSRLPAVARRWILTPRQSAVLALVAQGDSNRSVASKLGCSEKTVELHVSALLAKTHCASRSQLVASFWTALG